MRASTSPYQAISLAQGFCILKCSHKLYSPKLLMEWAGGSYSLWTDEEMQVHSVSEQKLGLGTSRQILPKQPSCVVLSCAQVSLAQSWVAAAGTATTRESPTPASPNQSQRSQERTDLRTPRMGPQRTPNQGGGRRFCIFHTTNSLKQTALVVQPAAGPKSI